MSIASVMGSVFPESLVNSVGGMYNLEMLVFSVLVIAVFIGISVYISLFVSRKIKEDGASASVRTNKQSPPNG